MKQFTKSLRMSLTTIILATFAVAFIGCSKSDSPVTTPPPSQTDYCPNMPGTQTDPAMCPAVLMPTGTVTPVSTGIAFNGNAGFNYKAYNASGVYLGPTYIGKDSGTYLISGLKDTTTFAPSITGSTGNIVNLPSITINVDRDTRVTFLMQPPFKSDYTYVRKKGTSDPWRPAPNGTIDNYAYGYNDVPDGPIGSSGIMGNPATATNNGSPLTFKWYFSGENFEAHGVSHHRFIITGPHSFETYDYAPAVIDGQLVDAEYRRGFK